MYLLKKFLLLILPMHRSKRFMSTAHGSVVETPRMSGILCGWWNRGGREGKSEYMVRPSCLRSKVLSYESNHRGFESQRANNMFYYITFN